MQFDQRETIGFQSAQLARLISLRLREGLAPLGLMPAQAAALIEIGRKPGLTQKELARRIGTHQSVIARLEDPDYRGHSLALLNRIWCGALEERLEHVLTDLGSENPSQHAQLVLAVVAGLEVNHMADAGASFYSDVAQPLVRELFRALVPNPSVAPSP